MILMVCSLTHSVLVAVWRWQFVRWWAPLAPWGEAEGTDWVKLYYRRLQSIIPLCAAQQVLSKCHAEISYQRDLLGSRWVYGQLSVYGESRYNYLGSFMQQQQVGLHELEFTYLGVWSLSDYRRNNFIACDSFCTDWDHQTGSIFVNRAYNFDHLCFDYAV